MQHPVIEQRYESFMQFIAHHFRPCILVLESIRQKHDWIASKLRWFVSMSWKNLNIDNTRAFGADDMPTYYPEVQMMFVS
jgi:hypothetical protein